MAITGFTYTLSWTNDFTEVDEAPEGFKDRDARTKANADLDPGLTGKRDAGKTEYYFDPASVKVVVKASKVESWVVKGQQSTSLLKHEQLHYNITALGGRDLERKILAIRANSREDLQKQKDDTKKEVQDNINKVNKDYDDPTNGTNHGKKAPEQSKWELHITNLMNKPDAELKGI